MKHTAMWQEIHDQPEVMEAVLGNYMPKAVYFQSILLKKKKLILTGTGASLYACYMAKYLFFKLSNLQPQVVPADELKYLLHSVGQDTLIIFISQSGESHETKLVGSLLKERGIEFWGITNQPESSLGRTASEILLLHSGIEVSSATKTNMASFLLLAILAAGHDEKTAGVLTSLPELLLQALDRADKGIDRIAGLLMEEKNLYILGLGVNAATAVEGALMMKEKTFIHTSGSSVSDFRHGSVEVIEDGLPILLIGSGEEYVSELMNHARYLKSTGAFVYAVVDSEPEECPLERDEILILPSCGMEEISPALFLIPLQLLSERIAVKKGLDVDGFRYLSKVVSKYGSVI